MNDVKKPRAVDTDRIPLDVPHAGLNEYILAEQSAGRLLAQGAWDATKTARQAIRLLRDLRAGHREIPNPQLQCVISNSINKTKSIAVDDLHHYIVLCQQLDDRLNVKKRPRPDRIALDKPHDALNTYIMREQQAGRLAKLHAWDETQTLRAAMIALSAHRASGKAITHYYNRNPKKSQAIGVDPKKIVSRLLVRRYEELATAIDKAHLMAVLHVWKITPDRGKPIMKTRSVAHYIPVTEKNAALRDFIINLKANGHLPDLSCNIRTASIYECLHILNQYKSPNAIMRRITRNDPDNETQTQALIRMRNIYAYNGKKIREDDIAVICEIYQTVADRQRAREKRRKNEQDLRKYPVFWLRQAYKKRRTIVENEMIRSAGMRSVAEIDAIFNDAFKSLRERTALAIIANHDGPLLRHDSGFLDKDIIRQKEALNRRGMKVRSEVIRDMPEKLKIIIYDHRITKGEFYQWMAAIKNGTLETQKTETKRKKTPDFTVC